MSPGYYREIISEAEYPFYTKKMFRIDKLTGQEKADIIEKDKKQYLNWFNRGKASCSSNLTRKPHKCCIPDWILGSMIRPPKKSTGRRRAAA